jgi:hypothetical protein
MNLDALLELIGRGAGESGITSDAPGVLTSIAFLKKPSQNADVST